MFSFAVAAATAGQRVLFFSRRGTGTLDARAPALPCTPADVVLQRIDVKFVTSFDALLAVLANLHRYPSQRIPHTLIVDDLLAVCGVECADEREFARRVQQACALLCNASDFCISTAAAAAVAAAPSTVSNEGGALAFTVTPTTASVSGGGGGGDDTEPPQCCVLVGAEHGPRVLALQSALKRWLPVALGISLAPGGGGGGSGGEGVLLAVRGIFACARARCLCPFTSLAFLIFLSRPRSRDQEVPPRTHHRLFERSQRRATHCATARRYFLVPNHGRAARAHWCRLWRRLVGAPHLVMSERRDSRLFN